ncbi:MAG: superfamily protein [Eubacterium sp.]|nr:superfamily protein [Eubacterium sp.]
MNKFKEMSLELALLLSIPLVKIIYFLLNNPGRGAVSLVTDIDRKIPFVKEFVVPYMIWYVFVFAVLIYFCFKDRKVYHRTLVAINLSLLICYAVYFVFQTTVPRPQLAGNDIFTHMVEFIYTIDRPYNCFPSIHSLVSFILIMAINRSKIKNRMNFSIITGISVSIILSTLFIKQHVILDAIAAILLGRLVFNFVYKIDMERMGKWFRKQYLSLTMKKKLGT